MLLMAAYAAQSVLIGIRWGYDIRAIMPFQAVLATLIAPLAWVAFSGLTKERSEHRLTRLWPHLLPACLVAVLLIFWREPVGPVIMLVFLSYGLALLWLALAGPDGLAESRLDGVLRSYRALLVTTLAILASPVTDIIISLDLEWTGGAHSGAVIAAGNVLALLLLGGAAAVASETAALDDEDDEEPRANHATGDQRRFRCRGSSRRDDAVERALQGCRSQPRTHRQTARPAGTASIVGSQPHPRIERVAICQQPAHRRSLPAAGGKR